MIGALICLNLSRVLKFNYAAISNQSYSNAIYNSLRNNPWELLQFMFSLTEFLVKSYVFPPNSIFVLLLPMIIF